MSKTKIKKSSMDEYLFHQGTNFNAYDYMGVHKQEKDGVCSYVFRVWAPNASNVYVAGDFNNWSKDNPMKRITNNGVWELVISSEVFFENSLYKFIISSNGKDVYKADPYAFYFETPPKTASIYTDISNFPWTDSKWLSFRKKTVKEPEYSMPLNIYEVHFGSWKKKDNGECYSYREIAPILASYVKEMGYTHIELLPIAEHPYDGSWGYQVTGYYAPTSRYGTPYDFMYFINYMHNAGIGVFLDVVPAHFPKDEHGLYNFDGGPLYEYQSEDKNDLKSWGTKRFDFGRNEVECFLMSNILFWLRVYHIDGIRVDAVSSMLYLDYDKEPGEWLPNAYGGHESLEAVAFFKKIGALIRSEFPDVIFAAEEATAWKNLTKPAENNGLGFNYKWNMGWMNDVLDYFSTDPLFRKYKHQKLTFSLMYAFNENYILPISHDEVVHGKKSLLDKMPGDYDNKFAGLRAFFMYMMTHPGKKLTFMGCEYAPFREWAYESELEWFMLGYEKHWKMKEYVKNLNHFYLSHKELWDIDYSWDGFKWLDCDNNDESMLVYKRMDKKGKELIIILNLTPVTRYYPIGIEKRGYYKQIFNSDDVSFGGGGCVDYDVKSTEKIQTHGYDNTLYVNIAGNSGIILKRTTKENTKNR